MTDTQKIRQELRDQGYLGICPRCFHANDMDHNTQIHRTCSECGLKFQVAPDKSDPYKLKHGGMGFTKNLSVENALKRQTEIETKKKAAADAEKVEQRKKAEDKERAKRLESFKEELKQAERKGKKQRYAEHDNPLLKDAQKRAEISG